MDLTLWNIHYFLPVHSVRSETRHSTGPDNRWALLFTLYPICSIMTQRKGVTEARNEENWERNVNPEQLGVNLWPRLKRTLSSQPCCWTGSRGGAAKFSRPLRSNDWWMMGEKETITRSQRLLPFSFSSRAKDPIRCCDGRAHASVWYTHHQITNI